MKDNVGLEHLRRARKPFDPTCSTCLETKLRHKQHRRNVNDDVGGELSGDLAGPLPTSLNGEVYLLVFVKRDSRYIYTAGLPDKRSDSVREAATNFKIDLRTIWRFHSDRGKEFFGAVDHWLKENLIARTTTEGYDPSANGLAERAIQEVFLCVRALLHQNGALKELWDEAATHAVDVLNRTGKDIPGHGSDFTPLGVEKFVGRISDNKFLGEYDDISLWPPWGCKAVALRPKMHRADKLEPVAVVGLFLGFDKVVNHGVQVSVLSQNYLGSCDPVEEIIVSTRVRTKDGPSRCWIPDLSGEKNYGTSRSPTSTPRRMTATG